MGNLEENRRSHGCGELRESDIGKEVSVYGFVDNTRELSGLTFIVLRDRSGYLQLAFSRDRNAELYETASKLRNEFVIMAKGKLVKREAANAKMATGEVELEVETLEVLSRAKTPPFEIKDDLNASEETRMKHRYLDLRRHSLQENFILRHKMAKLTRDFFDEEGFLEIETPFLIKATPEGARDFLVPSRLHEGKFFALPQSPQQYKQLLMMAGFEKYMQIVRCFRDEDLRADRQPEFTQIDLEMSFMSQGEIMELSEKYIRRMFKEFKGKDFGEEPFMQMEYDEALAKYGSDKPDLRFDMQLSELSNIVKNSEFKVFSSVVEGGGYVGAINAKGLAEKMSRKYIDRLVKTMQGMGAGGLAYLKMGAEGETSSYEKFLTTEESAEIRLSTNAETGDVIFIISDLNRRKAQELLGGLRNMLAREHGLFDPGEFSVHWVVNFPMFEKDFETGAISAAHHPFTSPLKTDLHLLESDPISAKAQAYDMVINGFEAGGGSIRISDPVVQSAVFKAIGYGEEEARQRFGFLMDALDFGVPPHGGLAFGLDRLVMIFAGTENIKDVIAFPKMQNASDLMSGSPSLVPKDQLDELHIDLAKIKED